MSEPPDEVPAIRINLAECGRPVVDQLPISTAAQEGDVLEGSLERVRAAPSSSSVSIEMNAALSRIASQIGNRRSSSTTPGCRHPAFCVRPAQRREAE